jgi:hypothetical protein
MATPEFCPNCGSEVSQNAKSCPECGSCEETGWSQEAATRGLDLPEEDFNYSGFVEREFGPEPRKPAGISWFWWVVGLVALGAILVLVFQ